jgi:glycosyltransferase involved in cell wall biosynthesis
MTGMPKKKIVIVDNSIAFTGAFKCAMQEATAMKNEYDFIFILPRKSNLFSILQAEGFSYHALPFKEIRKSIGAILLYIPFLICNSIRLKKILKKEKADFLQVNDFYNLAGAVVKFFGWKGKLVTYVRFLPSSRPSSLRKLWTKLALKYSHFVVAVSDAVRNQLPVKKNIIRLYDFIAGEEKYQHQDHLPLVRLLYLGNFINGKGQDHAIKAFEKAYYQNNNLRLKFVGGDMGLKKNKAYKKQLESEVIKSGFRKEIVFSEYSDDIEKEIKEADIVLNFSEAESFSMTCAEASYYGRSVIATRCGGPEEIITHQQTGLLVENKNIEEMSSAIVALAADKEKRKQFGDSGRQYVREKFSIENFQKNFRQVFSA